MNNKGFTLVELLTIIVLITIVSIVIIVTIGNTLSLSGEEAYKITKDNIIKSTKQYIQECNNDMIECNLTWNNNQTIIKASDLIEAGYFKEIVNPINNKKLDNCLTVEVEENNYDYNYTINDNNCQ